MPDTERPGECDRSLQVVEREDLSPLRTLSLRVMTEIRSRTGSNLNVRQTYGDRPLRV